MIVGLRLGLMPVVRIPFWSFFFNLFSLLFGMFGACANTGLITAWKVHFDGYGKGVYTGERATEPVGLEQYYGLLQKRKADFLSGANVA
jgi:hypothetical protein